MKNDCIEISGITQPDKYPEFCKPHYPHVQICETDKLCVPKNKPNIESICQVFIKMCISDYKTIYTPFGRKLVIEGFKYIKIIYTADEPCQNMHCAKFKVPFCAFIPLKDICKEVIDVCIGIEYINVHQLNCNCFTTSLIFNLFPIFKKKSTECNNCCECKPTINCDITVNCCNNDEYDCHSYKYNYCPDNSYQI